MAVTAVNSGARVAISRRRPAMTPMADLAVFRPGTGGWHLRQFIEGDTSAAFGLAGEIAVAGFLGK
jgi:hypothetical protein